MFSNHLPSTFNNNNLRKVQQTANALSKLSLIACGVCVVSGIYHHNYNGIIYSALTYLGSRIVSYLCKIPKSALLDSPEDALQGLQISNEIKIVAISNQVDQIAEQLKLENYTIFPMGQEKRRLDFVANQGMVERFLNSIENNNVEYSFIPIYANQVSVSPRQFFNYNQLSWKVSSYIHLTVFSPYDCLKEVSKAIENKQKNRSVFSEIYYQEGDARWAKIENATIPVFNNCVFDKETKITSEIHRSQLPFALKRIVHAHRYEEVGYDAFLTCILKKPKKTSLVQSIIKKTIKLVKHLFFLNNANLTISTDFKLTIYSPIPLKNEILEKIGNLGVGVIGDYAYCSFCIHSKTKVQIEAVVAKILFEKVTDSLKTYKETISYTVQPMFERINTKTLKQLNLFIN